jgi:hypothetical protein
VDPEHSGGASVQQKASGGGLASYFDRYDGQTVTIRAALVPSLNDSTFGDLRLYDGGPAPSGVTRQHPWYPAGMVIAAWKDIEKLQ